VTQRTFLDTNVLIYADDVDAGSKTEQARARIRQHLRDGDGVISTQVLQEYFVVATRKLGIEPAVVQRKMEIYQSFETVIVRVDMIHDAIKLHRLEPLSFWDALILTAARGAGCGLLLTEDLNDGQVVEGVRVQNPFTSENED
jgi:predicted nucleic acid-binding protein